MYMISLDVSNELSNMDVTLYDTELWMVHDLR